MFNWRYNFKGQTEFVSPEGPSFHWAPWKTFNISGTQIKIKVPLHRASGNAEYIDTKLAFSLDKLQMDFSDTSGIRLRNSVRMARYWEFYGPFFTGKKGAIKMLVNIFSHADISDGLNYFNPRALENSVADFLTSGYSRLFSTDGEKQMWLSPVNWKQQENFPCVAARFDATNTLLGNCGPECYLIFPIGKHHLLSISCNISRSIVFSDKKPKPLIDEWIDLAPLLKLANQVLDSVQVKLSPTAQADQEEALRGLDNKSLVKEFFPIKWTQRLKSEDI